MDKNFEVLEREIVSEGEQIAFVWTKSGGYITGVIPDFFTDVRDANILRRCATLEEAKAWFAKQYGISQE